MEEKKFAPTELGMIVTNLLVKNFPQIMDVQFTAALETKLDQIEQGATTRLDTLSGFYRELVQELEKAKKEMEDMKGEGIPTDMVCDKCGKPMVLKLGRNGRFYACSGYPECKNTIDFGGKDNNSVPVTETTCDKCGKPWS